MAHITFGIGTSHGPMLWMPPEQWVGRVDFDKTFGRHAFKGGDYSFEELVVKRAAEGLPDQITPGVQRQRHAACRKAIDVLAHALQEADVDVALMIGNDQMEIFSHRNLPAFLLFRGEAVQNIPLTEAQRNNFDASFLVADPGYHGPELETYPSHPQLAHHLIASLMEQGFDLAVSDELRCDATGRSDGAPHAFGFVYRQIMRGSTGLPTVPLFINTFYPPNQPSARRCFDLGVALHRAIRSWPSDLKVAVIGSGGFSHFVVDEELDRAILQAMRNGDRSYLSGLDERSLRHGTSEIRNWIPLAACMLESGLSMNLVDYVACYRSEAGTGSGMAFAYWR